MSTKRMAVVVAGLLGLAAPWEARAGGDPAAQEGAFEAAGLPSDGKGPGIDAHVMLQNVFLMRSDADFDRTKPYYDAQGQTTGAFATVLMPQLTWRITPEIRVFWESEIGLNYWSKNNPDQQAALASDVFVLKQRQIYGEGTVLDGRLGFKVGYQRFLDTTGLMFNHWIGAAQLWYQFAPQGRVGVFFGQVPDNEHEGITVKDNNFSHDIFVFGARVDADLAPGWRIAGAVHGVHDTHVVGKRLWLVAPNLRVTATYKNVTAWVDAILQYGSRQGAAQGGKDQAVLSWAAQGHVRLHFEPLSVRFNVLALSPDDAYDGNARSGAFLGSAKNASSLLYTTEDEIRDWFDNVDERISKFDGGFYANRAGLFVADVRVAYRVGPWFEPAAVLGTSMVLQPKNALDNRYLGTEAALDLAFKVGDHVCLHAVGGVLAPGKAAGALLNTIDRGKAGLVGWGEASMVMKY